MNARHIESLGSVRGIAALTVLIGHCILSFRLPEALRLPLDIVFNQRAAVLVFFVLSGYVLGLSWQRSPGTTRALGEFYVRRLFRILPAMWLACALTSLLLAAIPAPGPDAVPAHWTEWARISYLPVSLQSRLRAFTGLDNRLIPPMWTITIELAGSVVLPLLAATAARGRAWAVATLLALAALSLPTALLHSRLNILAYMVEFALGASLAVHRPRYAEGMARLAALSGLVLLFGGRQAFWLATTGQPQEIEYEINAPIPALIEAAGAGLLITALASGQVVVKALHWGPIRLLGDWSYSLYLFHFAFLRVGLALLPPLDPAANVALLALFTLALTVPASALVYRFVELPGIAAGKALLSRLAAPRPSPAS